MEGIAAVTARVQQIQGLVQSMQVPVRSTVVTATGAGGTATGAAFEQVLAQARATQTAAPGAPTWASGVIGAGMSAGAAVGSRAVDAEGVPLDLKSYGNGRIPASSLQGLGVGNHALWAPAAEGFARMRAAATADGVTIGVTDSYRSYDAQVDVAQRKGLYKDGGLAAVPGTSDHGWGLSLDLRLDDRAQNWMRANAGRFGFAEDVPREPWHWTFQP